MKILAYFLGAVVYVIVSFITMPITTGLKFVYSKIFNSIDSLYLGMIEGWIVGGLFILSMTQVFRWFKSEIPILFIVIVSLSVLINDYKQCKIKPNKLLKFGQLWGDLSGFIGFYILFADDHFSFW
ncbi:MAG: hypothetical protein JXR34_12930 [Bacteroidales bacterium]|nr:hypothetical protein [Bacteroidales bacterium]